MDPLIRGIQFRRSFLLCQILRLRLVFLKVPLVLSVLVFPCVLGLQHLHVILVVRLGQLCRWVQEVPELPTLPGRCLTCLEVPSFHLTHEPSELPDPLGESGDPEVPVHRADLAHQARHRNPGTLGVRAFLCVHGILSLLETLEVPLVQDVPGCRSPEERHRVLPSDPCRFCPHRSCPSRRCWVSCPRTRGSTLHPGPPSSHSWSTRRTGSRRRERRRCRTRRSDMAPASRCPGWCRPGRRPSSSCHRRCSRLDMSQSELDPPRPPEKRKSLNAQSSSCLHKTDMSLFPCAKRGEKG